MSLEEEFVHINTDELAVNDCSRHCVRGDHTISIPVAAIPILGSLEEALVMALVHNAIDEFWFPALSKTVAALHKCIEFGAKKL
jgi:hypothetical protein